MADNVLLQAEVRLSERALGQSVTCRRACCGVAYRSLTAPILAGAGAHCSCLEREGERNQARRGSCAVGDVCGSSGSSAEGGRVQRDELKPGIRIESTSCPVGLVDYTRVVGGYLWHGTVTATDISRRRSASEQRRPCVSAPVVVVAAAPNKEERPHSAGSKPVAA